jgi:hypothetical protein
MNSKEINNNIKKIGKLISLESKINIVGSASVKRNLYYSDYDLFENVKSKSEQLIYNHFKAIFNIIKSSPNVVISDFKLGQNEKGDPLRWDYSDIMKGENNGVSFSDALKMESIIKLDIIIYINNRFVEVSEVYNIYLNGKSNMTYSKNDVIKELINDYKELVNDGNYFKSMKRMYSIIKLNDDNDVRLNILVEYFNQPIGLLYRCKSDLETINIILHYNKFTLDQIRNSLQMLKEIVSAFPITNNLEAISKLTNKYKMKKELNKQIMIMKNYINKEAQKFLNSTGL